MENTIQDNYLEHELHEEFEDHCSECYKENRKLKAWELVNHKNLREQLGIDNHSILHPRGGGSPWEVNPFE